MSEGAGGHYYRKQLGCECGLIAWSHRSRFELGLHLVGSEPGRLLDYGCGDGTFLALAAPRLGEGWGVDTAADQVEDCRSRLAPLGNLRFGTVAELREPGFEGSFHTVTCMETLEHCVPDAVETVLADLARLVRPGGRVIISVPIEIGPPFLLKLALRRIAAARGLSDYVHYERYSLGGALRMIFARAATRIPRPAYGPEDAPYHSHYGFNWRRLRERVRVHLSVERTLFSPLGALGGWVSSQAWFLCRREAGAR